MATAYPLYKYDADKGGWERKFAIGPAGNPTKPVPHNLHVLSWNLDSSRPLPSDRANSVMDYLMTLDTAPHIIFFQDVHHAALNNIIGHRLAKTSYWTSNVTAAPWGGSKLYGSIALIHNVMPEAANYFRVPLPHTTQGTDGLFLDFKKPNGTLLRIGTTMLERGDVCASIRKAQLEALCAYIPPKCTDNCTSGLIIGETLESTPLPDGVRDAYSCMGGTDGGEEGFTWGMNCWPRAVGERRQRVLGSGNMAWSNLIRIGGDVKASGSPVSDGVGLLIHAAL